MHDTTPVSRRNRSRRFASRFALGFLSTTAALNGCRDAATTAPAPPPPHLAVFADGIWLVNSLADPGDGICTNSECTLREAIAAAAPSDRITFKSNLSGTIALTEGLLLIDKSLTIRGLGADLTVDGQNTSPVVQIGTGTTSVSAFLTDLAITRGFNPAAGGAVIVSAGSSLRVTRTTVMNSSATMGGGIYSSGTLTVIESTIARNTATQFGGGIGSHGVLTVETSTISSNAASYAGGGIHDGCLPLVCTTPVRLWNSTITNNAVTAATTDGGLGGGGVFTFFDVTAANTIVAGNLTNNSLFGPEADCHGTVISLGHSLTGTNLGCQFGAPSDVLLSPALIFTSVLDHALGDWGGHTRTHALLERGYAVDAGYCPGKTTDQRGLPRPFDDPAMPNALDACDIGAFEWQPSGKPKGPKP